MTGLLDSAISPVPAAFGAEPMTIAEIDAHPDAARIWATILAMRADHTTEVEASYDNGMQDCAEALQGKP